MHMSSVPVMPIAALDSEAIAAIDRTNQLGDVLGLGRHMRDALSRVDAAGIQPVGDVDAVVIAGMGGSAAGARLAVGALGQRLLRPISVVDGYSLPAWVGRRTLVVCSSYSGNTEETLAAYDDARRRQASQIVITTGGELARRALSDGVPAITFPAGFQPRAAIGYALVGALEVAALAQAAPSVRDEIEAAVDLAEALAAEWGPESPPESHAKRLATELSGTVPVIVGAELTAAAAYRWKCQFNENASIPAFASVLPEADHNEVVGWSAAGEFGSFSFVSLEDPCAHPRNALRSELTAELAAEGVRRVVRVTARGATAVERLVWLVMLGDLVSVYTAVLRGGDPVEIPAIDGLKSALATR